MTESEIEELERKVTGSDSVIVEEARSIEALPDHVGEDARNVLLEIGAEKQTDSLAEKEVAIVIKTAEVIERSRKDKLSAYRNVAKKKLLEEFAKVDKVLSKFKAHSITKTNELLYTGAVVVVTNRLGVKIDKVAGRKDKDITNFKHWERLERKYTIRVKRLNVVIEELKQRITAIAAKVGRYQGRVDNYRQKRLF